MKYVNMVCIRDLKAYCSAKFNAHCVAESVYIVLMKLKV